MLNITDTISLGEAEFTISQIRAQGPGGQNVNKVSTAVHLRFDIAASSLPLVVKERLLATRDRRISARGVVVIKAQQQRSLEKNRADALERLRQLILQATQQPKPRRATRPSRASRRRRLDSKTRHGNNKALRRKPEL